MIGLELAAAIVGAGAVAGACSQPTPTAPAAPQPAEVDLMLGLRAIGD